MNIENLEIFYKLYEIKFMILQIQFSTFDILCS